MPSADLNNDGIVNAFDLSILLSHWGTDESLADLNEDGTVDTFDLSILLSRWGTDGSGSGGEDPTSTSMMSSVEHHGITVNFDQDYPCGQFVNGDWFVVGEPVIISLDPAWEDGVNGAMINPDATVSAQGWHNRSTGGWNLYTSSTNVALALPFSLTDDQSLICAKGNPDGVGNFPTYVNDAMVLTCLSESPPVGSFRPQYCDGEKVIHNVSSLRWDFLPSLTPVSSTPGSWPTLRSPWLDHLSTHNSRYFQPSNHMPNYGRDIASRANRAILQLFLDYPQSEKEKTLIDIVQIGIDQFGQMESQMKVGRSAAGGIGWSQIGGGLGVGRKWPNLFAGIMLDYAPMRDAYLWDEKYGPKTGVTANPGPDGYRGYFINNHPKNEAPWSQEDAQIYIVPDDDLNHLRGVGEVSWAERAFAYYQTEYLPGSTTYRSCCTNNVTMAAALGARIMQHHTDAQAMDLWNYSPFFEYIDWYVDVDKLNASTISHRGQTEFFRDMWDVHRPQL